MMHKPWELCLHSALQCPHSFVLACDATQAVGLMPVLCRVIVWDAAQVVGARALFTLDCAVDAVHTAALKQCSVGSLQVVNDAPCLLFCCARQCNVLLVGRLVVVTVVGPTCHATCVGVLKVLRFSLHAK